MELHYAWVINHSHNGDLSLQLLSHLLSLDLFLVEAFDGVLLTCFNVSCSSDSCKGAFAEYFAEFIIPDPLLIEYIGRRWCMLHSLCIDPSRRFDTVA